MWKGTFYSCDLSNGTLRLWLKGGKQTIVALTEFKPFFFVTDAKLERKIKEMSFRSKGRLVKPLSVEKIKRKVDWEEKEILKVAVEREEDRREFEKRLNADLRFVRAEPWAEFIYESGIEPLSEVEVEGKIEEEANGCAIIRAEQVRSVGEGKEKLRSIYLCSIFSSENGFPQPERDPILVIACLTEGGVKMFEADERGDRALIEEFARFFSSHDPDLIIGYGQDFNEFPYLIKRAKLHGIELKLGKLNEQIIETGKYFRGMIVKETVIPGRLNIDLLPIVYRDFPQLPTKSLNEIAAELGLKQIEEIPDHEIKGAWEKERREVIRYAEERVKLIKKVADELLPFNFELAKLVKAMPSAVCRATIGEINDFLVVSKAYEQGLILPEESAEEREYYLGGEVWLKGPGIYEKVGTIDVKSMYPSIMIKYNISPETVDCPCCKGKEVIRVKEDRHEIRHWTCEKKVGFLSSLVKELIEKRSELKKRMKAFKEGSPEYKRLYAKQHVLKICANALYGYQGWTGSRLYRKASAELITALGRKFIRELKKWLEGKGYDVVYVDTDGIQVCGVDREECEELVEQINEQFPLAVDVERYAQRAIYWAKKKYCHLCDGKLVAKGIEFIRRDYPHIIKQCQREVVELLLKGEEEKARKVKEEYAKRLREGKVKIEDLVLVEQLAKKIEMYERTSKIKAAAEWLRENKGIELHRGMNLNIVIVKGGGPINYRARPMEFVELRDCDLPYYEKLFEQVMERTFEPVKPSLLKFR